MKNFNIKLFSVSMITLVCAGSLRGASAASATCSVGFSPASCETASISADGRNHFVHITVSPYMRFRVVDSTNGKVVARGTSGLFGVQRTISGLYAKYHAAIDFLPQVPVLGGHITIRNN